MTIECTIRFKTYNRETVERVLGSILLATEADTAQGMRTAARKAIQLRDAI